MRTTHILSAIALFLAAWAVCTPSLAHASAFPGKDEADRILKEIGVEERRGASVPPGLAFTDQDGRAVRLADYMAGKPALLTLNYYECPMLCPITFRNLAETVDEMKGLTLGRDYRIVTVSINPDETPDMARDKARETYGMLKAVSGPPGMAWPFLFGKGPGVDRLAKSVGFRYKRLGPSNFAHPSAFMVLTPEGRVSRYLYGVKVDPMDLRLALTEAAGGRIGASAALNRVLLFCYHYDPAGKKYVLAASNIMKAAGAFTALILGALLVFLWRKERAKGA